MTAERVVRGEQGPVAYRERGFTAVEIADWRVHAAAAGQPATEADFYMAHGLCYDCLGTGVLMAGWSAPADEVEVEAAKMLGLEKLPVCRPCQRCGGAGKTPVS